MRGAHGAERCEGQLANGPTGNHSPQNAPQPDATLLSCERVSELIDLFARLHAADVESVHEQHSRRKMFFLRENRSQWDRTEQGPIDRAPVPECNYSS
ncbi:hypothetical protein F2P81_009070 [Scophthalmus maximus]|uniref:Uncharacterized protein n=1 Tax=Scophthalmus maximus TaxID=52904 RepID=A0A6A4STN0_SCOMX|nr:hypothetical protein F2P81_009070 [Scophthalmus maximus]